MIVEPVQDPGPRIRIFSFDTNLSAKMSHD
jgi:hypothetical protein